MRCEQIKSDGQQCRGSALLNDTRCYLHSDLIPEAVKKEGMSRGGKNKAITNNCDLPNYSLTNIWQLIKFNAALIKGVSNDEIDLRLAEALRKLIETQEKLILGGDLEKRLGQIEDKLSLQDAA